jgi:peptidoglycan lytic transglycosylase G
MFGRRKQNPATVQPGPGVPPQRLAPRSPSEALKPTAAPPPPPRIRRPRGGLLSTVSGLLTLALVVALGAVLGVIFVDRRVNEPGPLADDKVVVIPRNSGVGEIAELLKREGVITQTALFEVYAYLNRQKGQLKAGEFLFKAHTSIDDAIDTLIQGKAILHALTIPEGLTSEQIMVRLRENDTLAGEVAETPREGTLLPDTYKFERGTTRQQLVNSMQRAQREVLNQTWARRAPDLAIKTPQELVILASIVEKETGRADERTRVAGVFMNRLAKRMKLQSDPTIVYGLVGGQGTLGRGILRSEIEKATPYNTYVVEGLPPGPIANPGRAALEAVANPSRTRDLYFVADGTGGHVFAETLEQHQRNVARWRQIEKARIEANKAAESAVDRFDPVPAPDGTPPGPAVGANPGSDPLVPGGRQPAAPAKSGKRVDASEGTPRDPLLNRTYDLTTPKTVPTFRQR